MVAGVESVLFDRLIIALLALFFSAVFYGKPFVNGLRLDLPGRLMAAFIIRSERKLNRGKRSAGTLVYRGIILLLLLLLVAISSALALHQLFALYPPLAYLEIAFLAWSLPVRRLTEPVRRMARALRKKNLPAATLAVRSMARRHIAEIDQHGMVRVAIEYLMENLCDKIIAPLLAYLLFGLAGAWTVRIINLADGMVGYRSKRYVAFGWAAARMDDVVQWFPARIGGLIILLAALFIPKGRPAAAVKILARDRGKTRSPNNGWPIAASAGALGLTLGGPRYQGEGVVDDAWIGQGTAKASLRDASRAQWLYGTSLFITGFLMAISILALA